jgi:hypothetical protein
MAFPTGTETAPVDAASSDDKINSLLGEDLSAVETEAPAEEDTSVADRGTEVEEETESGVETADEPEAEEAEGDEGGSEEEQAEEETGEEDFDVSTLETDFAESAYERAAAHYSKQFGKQLDPNDQGDRAILRELMERGRKISELQTAEPEEEEEEGTEAATEEKPAAVTAKTPEEVFTAQIESARTYAKGNVNPIAVKELFRPVISGLFEVAWGEKGINLVKGKTDAELVPLAQAMDSLMTLKGMEIAGGIIGNVPKAVEGAYPFFSKSQDLAEKEAAVDEILGDPAYAGFDKLVDSGAINQALASPELKNAVFNRDPFKNRVAKLKFAYKLARGQRPDPKVLGEAVKRGKEAEKDRARRVAAGRTLPGSSSRGAAPATRGNLIGQLVQNGSSRAAKLFRDVGRQKS